MLTLHINHKFADFKVNVTLKCNLADFEHHKILLLLFCMFQLSDAISIIGREDFPDKWPDLIPEMVSKFETGDFHVINGVLRTAHSLFKRCVMHQSFVTTAPHLRGRAGDSQAEVQGNYISSVLSVQGK